MPEFDAQIGAHGNYLLSVDRVAAGLLDLSSDLAQGAADYDLLLTRLCASYGVSRETIEPRMKDYAASVPHSFFQINWWHWVTENVCCPVAFLAWRQELERQEASRKAFDDMAAALTAGIVTGINAMAPKLRAWGDSLPDEIKRRYGWPFRRRAHNRASRPHHPGHPASHRRPK